MTQDYKRLLRTLTGPAPQKPHLLLAGFQRLLAQGACSLTPGTEGPKTQGAKIDDEEQPDLPNLPILDLRPNAPIATASTRTNDACIEPKNTRKRRKKNEASNQAALQLGDNPTVLTKRLSLYRVSESRAICQKIDFWRIACEKSQTLKSARYLQEKRKALTANRLVGVEEARGFALQLLQKRRSECLALNDLFEPWFHTENDKLFFEIFYELADWFYVLRKQLK